MIVYDNFFSKRTAKGTYIDLGAGDGIQNSNTLAYEKKGWVGMLQEDEPSLFDEMVNRYLIAFFRDLITIYLFLL